MVVTRRSDACHLAIWSSKRGARVGVLALGVGEQLDGEDVGVAVDDAPDQHGARLRRLRRALLDARHEHDERGDVEGEPDHAAGTSRRQSATAKMMAAPTHCTAAYQMASTSCTTDSRSAGPVWITLLATRPAKSFWKKPRLWRST